MPKTVLILEPEPAFRRLIQINLKRHLKCNVIEAGNLQELREILQRETVDLAVKAVSFLEEEESCLCRAGVKTLALKYPGDLSRLRGMMN